MQALIYEVTGGPEVLQVVEVAELHAGPGQVRVAVRGAGVNPFDWKLRSGLVPAKLPVIPGSEVAGVIDEVGADVVGSRRATPGTAG